MMEATTRRLETYSVPYATAQNTILGLENQVLWQHDTSERIESYNGTHFKNSLVTSWAKEHGEGTLVQAMGYQLFQEYIMGDNDDTILQDPCLLLLGQNSTEGAQNGSSDLPKKKRTGGKRGVFKANRTCEPETATARRRSLTSDAPLSETQASPRIIHESQIDSELKALSDNPKQRDRKLENWEGSLHLEDILCQEACRRGTQQQPFLSPAHEEVYKSLLSHHTEEKGKPGFWHREKTQVAQIKKNMKTKIGVTRTALPIVVPSFGHSPMASDLPYVVSPQTVPVLQLAQVRDFTGAPVKPETHWASARLQEDMEALACPSQHDPGHCGELDMLSHGMVTMNSHFYDSSVRWRWWQYAQRGLPGGSAVAALYRVPSSISHGRGKVPGKVFL
ncbi:hypothetical protein WISP_07661 [Willisornis vidua]|uniref:Uncharacterized protein n=1 Tax=Willisornis vidua TaxID=1566151 RepID=A0ABQ9DSF2_9PASS|nr:hypothetical protein WISP_07661 [Willisornis vidua]